MDRHPVLSSNVASIGYDPASKTLEVAFNNGSVYQYYNVPQGVFDQFKAAPSKKQFLAYHIKDSFPYARV